MANANLTLVTLANTFTDWLNLTDNEANTINELRNGNFYKDGGNFTVATGSILIITPTGTTLSVTANALVSGYLTTGNLAITQNLTVTGGANVANLNATGTINTSSNVLAGNATFTQNISTGNISVTQNSSVGNISVTTLANVANINVSANALLAGNTSFIGFVPSNTAAVVGITVGKGTTGNVHINMNANAAVANTGLWEQVANVSANQMVYRLASDDRTGFANWLRVTRTVTGLGGNVNVANIWIGNATDNPSVNIFGTLNVSGTLAAATLVTPNAVTYANGTAVVQTSNINFNNTASINVSITANGVTQANVALNVNVSSFMTGGNTQILFADNTSANVINANSNFNYDKVNVFVGIGTSTPNANLDINGQIRANNYSERYVNIGTVGPAITNSTNYWTFSNIAFFTGNATVTSAGQGTGAASAWDKLAYTKNTFTTGTLAFRPGTNGCHVMVGFSSTPVVNLTSYASLDYALYYQSGNSNPVTAYSDGINVQGSAGGAIGNNVTYSLTFDGTTMKIFQNTTLLFSNTAAANGTPFSSIKNFHLAIALFENTANAGNCNISLLGGAPAVVNVNCQAGDFQDIFLVNNAIIQLNNAPLTGNTGQLSLLIRQQQGVSPGVNANGNWGVAFSNTLNWSDGLQPALSGVQNTSDLLFFKTYNAGGFWLSSQIMGNTPNANVY